MTSLRPRKPSASMIVALIALFVALGGSSYAAVTLAKNSVGSKQLKKNAVTTKKIKKHAVTASKINPAGLTVPNATNAGHANSAGAVDGSNITSVKVTPATSTTATIFSGDGLTLTAVCDSSGQIGITAQSSDSHAELQWFGQKGGALQEGEFTTTGSAPLTLVPPSTYEGSMDIVFVTTSGHSVTANLGLDFVNAFGTSGQCGVFGKVISS